MEENTVKVHVTARETVEYDQIIELPEHEWERLKEALDMAEEDEIEWIIDQNINREAVVDAHSFEVIDVVEVKPKKEKKENGED